MARSDVTMFAGKAAITLRINFEQQSAGCRLSRPLQCHPGEVARLYLRGQRQASFDSFGTVASAKFFSF